MFAIKIQVFLKWFNMHCTCSPCRFVNYIARGHLNYTNVYKYCDIRNEQGKTKLQLQNIAKITYQLIFSKTAIFLWRWFLGEIINQKKLHAMWLLKYMNTHFLVSLTYTSPKLLLVPWLNNVICTIIICNNIICGHLWKEAKMQRALDRQRQ